MYFHPFKSGQYISSRTNDEDDGDDDDDYDDDDDNEGYPYRCEH